MQRHSGLSGILVQDNLHINEFLKAMNFLQGHQSFRPAGSPGTAQDKIPDKPE